jgi:hypothetical protein
MTALRALVPVADHARHAAASPAPALAPQALPLRLTAIAILLLPMGPWYVRPAILALAGAALLSSRVLFSTSVWIAATLLVGIRIVSDWPLADNHVYLLAYWCLAIALAAGARDAVGTLAMSGRWLIGTAFTLAVLWKAVLASDFVDGRFFRVTLVTDPRFQEATMLIGGLAPADVAANAGALSPLPEGAEPIDPPALLEPFRFRALVALSTWGILALEILVAAAMFLPFGPRQEWMRHAVLIAFCFVTYAMAPVAGFGWLLLIMGLAGTGGRSSVLNVAYLAAFLLVLLYAEVPWPSLVLGNVKGA